jgi:glycosyltransferase involved in cell wall biosynthesis
MKGHTVSIVLCTYNGSLFLKEQLQSVLDQTYINLEIIVVDDGSTDGTRLILSEYAQKDNRVQLHFNKKNLGYIKNFEKGMQLASGEFIALCDQDDFWHPNKIEASLQEIESYDAVYCDSEFTDQNLESTGKCMSDEKNMYAGMDIRPFLLTNCVSGHAMIFRKSILGKALPFSDIVPHDWWIAITAAAHQGIIYIDQPLIKYRKHDSNVILGSKKKQSNKEKQKFRKQRTLALCNHVKDYDATGCATILASAYAGGSISQRINRVLLGLKHRAELFYIFKKSGFSKFWLPISLFFKLK